MFGDDLDPQKQMQSIKNLEPLSLNELSHYIEELKEEIVRTEQEIVRKKASMDAASAAFK